MTPRRRGPGHGLPPNTYANRSGGRIYYRWIHPVTGRKVSLGPDREEAAHRGELLNEEVRNAYGAVSRREITFRGGDLNTAKMLERWWDQYVPRQDWSPRYRNEMRILRDRYTRLLGAYSFLGITRTVLQRVWSDLTAHSWHRHRNFWIHVFRYAISQSPEIRENEAEATLTAPAKGRQRKRSRHTIEGYRTIRGSAPRDLQVAMDLALYSLQRRDDLVKLKRDAVDRSKEPWMLHVSPAKVAKQGLHLRIAAPKGSRLRESLEAALALPAELGVMTPYLLAHRPARRRHGGGKASVYQWSPDSLTRAFTAARDESGAYAELSPELRPTLHQLRALGAWLYQEAGYAKEHVQAIMGHSTVAMTQAYQDGHGIEWKDIEAGL